MLDRHNIEERRQAVATAIGSVRMEGLDVDALTLAELDRFARGEVEIADLLQWAQARVKAGDFRGVTAQ